MSLQVPKGRGLSAHVLPRQRRLQRRVVASAEPPLTPERLLRYPTGEERVIRYPSTSTTTAHAAIDGSEAATERLRSTALSHSSEADSTSPSGQTAAPDSPAALSRLASAAAASRASQPFAVLASPPALVRLHPRLYLLLDTSGGEEEARPYALPTRLEQPHELDELLGLPAGALGAAALRDGLLAFEALSDAEQFVKAAVEEGLDKLSVVAAATDELFAFAKAGEELLILLPAGRAAPPPRPAELAMLLRSRREPPDEW